MQIVLIFDNDYYAEEMQQAQTLLSSAEIESKVVGECRLSIDKHDAYAAEEILNDNGLFPGFLEI